MDDNKGKHSRDSVENNTINQNETASLATLEVCETPNCDNSLSQDAQARSAKSSNNFLNTVNSVFKSTTAGSTYSCNTCDHINETFKPQRIINNRNSIHIATPILATSQVSQPKCLEKDFDWETLKEVAIQSIDLNVATCSTGYPRQIPVMTISSSKNSAEGKINLATSRLPFIVVQSPTANRSPVTLQPLCNISDMTSPSSPMSLITLPNQPKSLFLQALSKLDDSSVSLAVVNYMRRLADEAVAQATVKVDETASKSSELSPPDSLTSAPPSYSFVLRQSAARRRPRLMGTFIPSPSFVQHTPPPNYAAAFDIYVDNPVPPQPTRVYSFGFTPMPVVCPECGCAGLTATRSKITLCTHLCALILCLFCCWLCAPLPYVMRSCKDVYHYCRNCGYFLGMYSPSNPESTYPV